MIKVKNVSKIYKTGNIEVKALKDISFHIREGEFVAIIGASGSGKSTLMHILGCLDVPSRGQYFLDNKEVSQYSEDELAEIRLSKIGFVFQSFNLLPRTTVLKNVILPLLYSKISKRERERKALFALQGAGLEKNIFHHLSNQISGGEKQRVAIARALINNPSVILADEPTGNLDSKTGDIVLQTFRDLNRQGKTIILITHEKYIAQKAKRVITLKDGRIIEDTVAHKSKETQRIKE